MYMYAMYMYLGYVKRLSIGQRLVGCASVNN